MENCQGNEDCKEVFRKLNLLLDSECTEAERITYIKHIEECPGCLEMYNIEKAFKEFISYKCKSHTVPAGLVEGIREKIQAEGLRPDGNS